MDNSLEALLSFSRQIDHELSVGRTFDDDYLTLTFEHVSNEWLGECLSGLIERMPHPLIRPTKAFWEAQWQRSKNLSVSAAIRLASSIAYHGPQDALPESAREHLRDFSSQEGVEAFVSARLRYEALCTALLLGLQQGADEDELVSLLYLLKCASCIVDPRHFTIVKSAELLQLTTISSNTYLLWLTNALRSEMASTRKIPPDVTGILKQLRSRLARS